MLKGWQSAVKKPVVQPAWGQDRPRPPQGSPPQKGVGRAMPSPAIRAKGNTWQQEEQFAEAAMEEEEQMVEEPQTTTATARRPGETDRQYKVRMMAEKIRAEAKRARETGAEPGSEDAAIEEAPAKRQTTNPVADKLQEERDGQKFEEMLPSLEDKVSSAEDEAEKVAIVAAPLTMEAMEELKELQMGAIRETERAVKVAVTALLKIRREMEAFQKQVEGFAPTVKEQATEEMDKLMPRLDAAQVRLEEYKNVRKDHELALQGEKLFGELAQRLAGVEIDCEKASMMSEPLAKALDTNPNEINTNEIRETKEALRVAQATLAPTMRLISGKVAGLKGPIRAKMLDLQSRAEASQSLLDRAQQTVEEAQSRAAAIPILKQAQDRVASIEDVLLKMRETEAPFLMGLETMPAEDASEVLARMDKASSLAQSAIADAAKYISLKSVEVGRLAEGAAEAARKELEGIKQQLDEGMERVKRFQVEAGKRRRVNLVEVVRTKIEEAETAIAKMKEAGAELLTTEVGSLATALEKAHVIELEAQNAVTNARRELQEKQHDLRPLNPSQDNMKNNSEILRIKVRVNYMETELNKFRKVAKEQDEKIKVGKSLTEVLDGLKDAEQEVDAISVASQGWPQDQPAPQEAQQSIGAIQNKLSAATMQVERKLSTAQGLELKELRVVFGRLQRSQSKLDKVKEAVRDRGRALSMKTVKEAAEAVRKAEVKVASLNVTSATLDALSVSKLESMHNQVLTANELIDAARILLTQSQGMETSAKVEFARLHLRFKQIERKGKAQAEVISAHWEQVSTQTTQQVLDALRAAARRGDRRYDSDALFNDLSEGSGEITEPQFCDFFTKHKSDLALSAEKVKLAFSLIAPHGLMRKAFSFALSDFYKVIRDITITDEFEIHSAKKVRKLEVGEIVEVTGETKKDANLNLERMKCRAVRDAAAGWATLRSTAGATYFARTKKPFIWCAADVALRSEHQPESEVIRELKLGEVLELIEGPREEKLGRDLRVRGASCSEDTSGWLQVRSKNGVVLAKLSTNIYKCVEAIAMTDTSDFDNCTMVRRIDSGEALEMIIDQDAAKPGEGGTRRKFKACRDGAEGWVTVEGSQRTVYLKKAAKHYTCLDAAPLHAGLGAESTVVRILMPGEAFAAFEEPKEVSGGEKQTSFCVRDLIDGKEGWVTSTSMNELQPWSPKCKMLRTATLTSGFPANEAAEVIEVIRLLEVGELVTITEQPTKDTSSMQLRARCVAERDKAVGWVTVCEGGNTGSLLLRPATEDELKPGQEAQASEELGEAAPTTPPLATAPPADSRGLKRPLPSTAPPHAAGKPLFKGKQFKGTGKGKFRY